MTLLPRPQAAAEINIVEATISDLQSALSTGRINAVQLAAKHLHRVARYDRRGPQLNSIPVFNLDVFEHAQESDHYRSRNNGATRSPLEGIPGTIKDSYMMAGLTVAAGSPAFQHLVASDDAFTVSQIRQGGGIVLGKTNMPPLANGGMQRGVYGRAESPYNKDFLTAAFASGSSNGAASSLSSSMCAFAMAEETVSSGRSPASNNGLVAYTPSPGILSIRGNWPLFPIADVVVPYSRTVDDMLTILDIIAVEDEDCVSDFWRGQPFIKIPSLSSVRPTSYASLADSTALQGKRIAVPKMYIGKLDPAAQPVWTCEAVRHLWAGAASTLRSLGAVVEEVDFPLITNYEFKSKNCEWATEYPQPGDHYGETGPAGLFEHALHNFLAMVNDTSCVTKLEDVDHSLIFPQLPGSVQDRYSNRIHDRDAESAGIVQAMATRADDIFKVPGLEAHLKDLQARRKRDLDDWMEANAFDAVVWPAAGDVGPQDAETNEPSAEFAWRNGVWVSNGNLAIRQLGIPTVTVPMGLMEDKRMPVGLTFASKTYDDSALLSYASAFEKAHNKRPVPPRTPHLSTDTISGTPQFSLSAENKPPHLEASAGRAQGNLIQVSGRVDLNDEDAITVQVFVDGIQTSPVRLENGAWMVSAEAIPYVYATELPGAEFRSVPEQEKALVVVVATSQQNNRSTGKLIFI